MIRDILCNQIPLVFRKELYGSIAFLSAWIYFGLSVTSLSATAAILITLFTGFSLRILAIYTGLELPKFSFEDRDKSND